MNDGGRWNCSTASLWPNPATLGRDLGPSLEQRLYRHAIEGVIDLEREVELYISATANVGGVSGVMSRDESVRLDGEKP